MHIGHQVLLETLRRIRRAVVPGGVLAFETRNPDHRKWDNWTPAQTTRTRSAAFGQLREWLEVTSAPPGVVILDSRNVFPDKTDGSTPAHCISTPTPN